MPAISWPVEFTKRFLRRPFKFCDVSTTGQLYYLVTMVTNNSTIVKITCFWREEIWMGEGEGVRGRAEVEGGSEREGAIQFKINSISILNILNYNFKSPVKN